MSAISASSVGLTSYLQGLSVTPDAQTAQAATTSGASSTDPSANTQGVEGHHHHHHHHGGGGGGSFSKIEQAVTSALQTAQEDGTADPNTIIKDAITKVLQGSSQGTSASTTPATATDTDADTNAGATDQAASGSQGFTALLQSLGVDPQQFHADFVGAVQAAQGGQVDPSTALQSFPPGTTIDTTA
jgi:hypothetical protein